MKMAWLDTSGGDVREMEDFIEIVPCHCQHHRHRTPYCRVGHESSNVICISFGKMGQNVKCICICTEKVLQHSGSSRSKGLKPWVLLKMTNADGKNEFYCVRRRAGNCCETHADQRSEYSYKIVHDK